MQRFLTEQDAGRTVADLVTTSDQAAFVKLARDGKLLPFKPAGWELIPDGAKDKDGAWVAQRINLIVPVYRSDKVSDPPKAWKDLAAPRFKGQLVTPDPAFTSIAYLVVHRLSNLLGWDYYQQLAANDVMIVQGHAEVAQALLGGERSLAMEADITVLFPEMDRGAPIKLVYPDEGVFLINSPQGIPAKAPHPNVARALEEYILSPDVQALFTRDGLYGVRTDVAAPKALPALKDLKSLEVDYPAAEADNKKVKDQFSEIFH
jgi:iron(III) transport system substrate-binding protein